MKSTFETMTFFHTPIRLVELLILYACVQFYTHQASDYRLISQTALLSKLNVSEIHNKINIANLCPICKMLGLHYNPICDKKISSFSCKNVSNATILILNTI